MDDFELPKIDPELLRISKEISQRQKKEQKRKYLKDHFFDIYHAALSAIAILISIAALIVSLVSLSFSTRNQAPSDHPEVVAPQAETKECQN